MEPADQAHREKKLFEQALELASSAERLAFLKGACGDDAALLGRIQTLLQAHQSAEGFLPGQPAGPTIVIAPSEKPGDRIGRYKLREKVGEGGCGVVYVAEQEEPVRRKVALKVIKLGMDTQYVVARFEAERQALAMMDHPNIAKVFDAGATETGRPYFVMELVRGIKITEYCDQNCLPTKERLDLFIKVCQAVQHAHQKGIIHRDLKPSNILVTLHDGAPVPKVIDFGIAKATEGRLTDATVYTQLNQFIGTPAYMSPEQAEMSGLDIDTRSDIYSLGVLLYELLTGSTPFDAQALMDSGLDAMRKTIREEEPVRPSTRLATLKGDALTTTAKRRSIDTAKLVHQLKGDLDWIVMKCLEKDRTRRYDTATGLALDIERHVEDEPVLARPPGNLYRFQKLVRRNKLAFAAAGAVAAALVIGLGLFTWMFFKERAARQRADAAEQAQGALLKEAQAGRALEARMRQEAEIGRKYAEAGTLLNEHEIDKAEEIVRQIPPRSEGAGLYESFGQIHARNKEWLQAITNFMMETQLAPSNHLGYHSLAPLLVQAGDLDEYRHLRTRILRQFGETSDPVVAERMAKDCLILPPTAAELTVIDKMADTALAAGPKHTSWPYFQFVKGLAEYRQNRFGHAAELLEEVAAKSEDVYLASQARLVLAMSRHQLHQFWPARGQLSYGCGIAANYLPSDGNKLAQPNDWVIIQWLMREAQPLIETDANNDTVAKAFDAVAGRYDYGAGVNTISRAGNHLFAQLAEQPKVEITPKSATEFEYVVAADAQITFVIEAGKVVKAIHHQNGTMIDAPRLDEVVDAKVDPASYGAVVGEYEFSQTPDLGGRTNSALRMTLTVTREEGRLLAQLSGRPKYEILPKSELEFFWKDLNAQVTFVKDEHGKVSKAIFHQFHKTSEASRIK